MNFKEEIFKSIQDMVDKYITNYKSDHTYQSIIKGITSKGYIVLDETGQERTAKCCIPGVELKVGASVLIKIPNGDLKQIHIVGINGNTTAITTATKIGSSTVGSAKNPVYVNKGEITACSSTIGNASVPVYMSKGTIKACTSSMITYSDTEPLNLNFGATWIDA